MKYILELQSEQELDYLIRSLQADCEMQEDCDKCDRHPCSGRDDKPITNRLLQQLQQLKNTPST